MGKAATHQQTAGGTSSTRENWALSARRCAASTLRFCLFALEIILATLVVAAIAVYLTAAAILRRLTEARAGMRGKGPADHRPASPGAVASFAAPAAVFMQAESPQSAIRNPSITPVARAVRASGPGGTLSFRPRPAIGPAGRLDAAAVAWAFDPDFTTPRLRNPTGGAA